MRHVLTVNPDSLAGNLHRSQALYKAGQFVEAARVLQKNADRQPNHFMTRLFLGEMNMDLQRYDDARAHYDAALATIITHTGAESELANDSLLQIIRTCARHKQVAMVNYYGQLGLALRGQAPMPPPPATQPSPATTTTAPS